MNQSDILRRRIPRAKSPLGSFAVTDKHGIERSFETSEVAIGVMPGEYSLTLSTSLDGFRALIEPGNASIACAQYECIKPTSPPFSWRAECSQPAMAPGPIVRVTIRWPIPAVQDRRPE